MMYYLYNFLVVDIHFKLFCWHMYIYIDFSRVIITIGFIRTQSTFPYLRASIASGYTDKTTTHQEIYHPAVRGLSRLQLSCTSE